MITVFTTSGTGDVHVGGVLHHEDEVGDRRGIDVAAGAGAHDHADLRHDATGQYVLQEDVGVAGETVDALLDPGAAGVEQADDRGAVAQGHLLHLDDLAGVGAGKRAAEHREILGEDVDVAAVDRAPAGDHAVAGDALLLHAEVVAAVLDEHVELLERAFVEQDVDAFARGELALGVLGRGALGPAPRASLGAAAVEFVEDFAHRGLARCC